PARHIPHHQRKGSLGLFDSQRQELRLAAAGLHAGVLRGADPQSRRCAGPCHIGARRQSVAGVCHRCRHLSRRRRFPGRRRGPRQSTVWRRPEFLNEQGLIFGACYQSIAVVPDGTPQPAVDDPVTEYVPSARPGSRAPHVWLTHDNQQISTIDMFGPQFVLLAGSDGEAWQRAAQAIGPSCPPLIAVTIGKDGDLGDPDGNWHEAYGVDTDGAVLVRPDGHVAWRSRTSASNPLDVLRTALDRLFGRMPAIA